MTDSNSEQTRRKLKFEGSEYYLDSLPEDVNQIIAGINAADLQTRMYQDTLKLIAIGKSKLVGELKSKLDNIEPIED